MPYSKKQLQIILSRLEPVSTPKAELEQYQTPPDIAADVLNTVNLHENLQGKTVLDLGAGNGVFAIGAALLGAEVIGVDADSDAIETARFNAEQLHREHDFTVEFRCADVSTIAESADVVVMNPPFGIQEKDANKPFLETAFKSAPLVFALLHVSTRKKEETDAFYTQFSAKHGFHVQQIKQYAFPLPRTQVFHSKQKKHIPVGLYVFHR